MSQIISFALMGVLLFAPLPYGSVHPWAYSLIEIVVFGLCFLWVLKIFTSREPFRYRPAPFDLPVLLFLLLCLFQLLPLPSPLLQAISPIGHARYESALLGSLASPVSSSLWHPSSLYPFATWRALLLLFAYVGVFYLILYHVHSTAQIRRLLAALLLIGSFEALYGLYRHFSNQPILAAGRASGTFINPNHYAGYLEIVIPLSLALLLIFLPPPSPGISFKERIIALANSQRPTLVGLTFLGLLIMVVAVIFSISRAGIMSLAASLLFFVLGSLYLRRGKRWTFVVLLLVCGALLLGLWEGLGPVEERFLKASESALGRYKIWPAVMTMVKDFPLLGTGLGTFGSAFLGYQREFPSAYFDHAHNDYLEILAETGWTGFLLLLAGSLIFIASTLARLPKVQVREARLIALGGLSAIFGLLIHSLFDFNLAIPSNALSLTVAAGLTHQALRMEEGRP
jgi:O-antigen ligase